MRSIVIFCDIEGIRVTVFSNGEDVTYDFLPQDRRKFIETNYSKHGIACALSIVLEKAHEEGWCMESQVISTEYVMYTMRKTA